MGDGSGVGRFNDTRIDMQANGSLIVAHFHRHGRLRSDTAVLLRVAQSYFRRILFVSTHLDPAALRAFPNGIEIYTRPNVGYDFCSYRLGLLRVLQAINEGHRRSAFASSTLRSCAWTPTRP